MEKSILMEKILQQVNTGILVIKNGKELEMVNEEGKKALKIKDDFHFEKLPQEFLEIINKNENIERHEMKIKSRIIGISATVTKENSDIYLIMIFKDITKIKKREQIDKKNEKFRMLGEVVVSLAHEIKNALNLIRGFSQLVMEADELSSVRENQRMVIVEVDRLNKLTKNMLDYTKKDILNREHFDIVFFAEDLLKYLGLDNMITLECQHKKIEIYADKDKMMQVFLNIIKNAIDAIKDEKNGIINIRIEKEGEVRIIFENNGHISKSLDITKIFNPFFTTKPDGTGLGLAITKKIVEEHGGDLIVYKNKINGLTFEITIS